MKHYLLKKSTAGLILFLLFFTGTALAQDNSHTVERGETLFSIAKQYDISVQQLKEWNDIEDNDALSVGQSLIVNQQATESDDSITHTVEKQETLFSISKQYNVSIAEIKSWNDLSSENLSVGQELIIYPSKANTSQKESIVVDEETQQNTYYTVKSGDSLYRIAEQHDMTVDELKELNNLSSNTIRVGQQLTVRGNGGEAPPSVATEASSSPQGKFISYEISGGTETLSDILEKFRMGESEFRALNPGVDDDRFQSGQTLTVLAPPNRTFKNPYLSDKNMESLGTATASQYGRDEKAKTTTNGELYNPEALTGAHSNISLGSIIFVENPNNNKGVYIRINDRNSGNGLKLSAAAWEILDFDSSSPKVTIYQN